MNIFKYKLEEKVMSSIAAPRNAESFGHLILYNVIGRISIETKSGTQLSYQVRPSDVRDGTIYNSMQVEEESLKSVDEYNAALKEKEESHAHTTH